MQGNNIEPSKGMKVLIMWMNLANILSNDVTTKDHMCHDFIHTKYPE